MTEIQKSAKGIVSHTLLTEGQNKSGTSFVQSKLTASDQQYPLPLALPLDEQVIRNKGAAGIDGMMVEQLPDYLKTHWPRLRQQLDKP